MSSFCHDGPNYLHHRGDREGQGKASASMFFCCKQETSEVSSPPPRAPQGSPSRQTTRPVPAVPTVAGEVEVNDADADALISSILETKPLVGAPAVTGATAEAGSAGASAAGGGGGAVAVASSPGGAAAGAEAAAGGRDRSLSRGRQAKAWKYNAPLRPNVEAGIALAAHAASADAVGDLALARSSYKRSAEKLLAALSSGEVTTEQLRTTVTAKLEKVRGVLSTRARGGWGARSLASLARHPRPPCTPPTSHQLCAPEPIHVRFPAHRSGHRARRRYQGAAGGRGGGRRRRWWRNGCARVLTTGDATAVVSRTVASRKAGAPTTTTHTCEAAPPRFATLPAACGSV